MSNSNFPKLVATSNVFDQRVIDRYDDSLHAALQMCQSLTQWYTNNLYYVTYEPIGFYTAK